MALCGIDPLTQIDHGADTVELGPDAVVIVDGVFALRAELRDGWDLSIWVEVSAAQSLQRGIRRDSDRDGRTAAREVHEQRYAAAAEEIYLSEVDAPARADLLVDNSDFAHPRLGG